MSKMVTPREALEMGRTVLHALHDSEPWEDLNDLSNLFTPEECEQAIKILDWMIKDRPEAP